MTDSPNERRQQTKPIDFVYNVAIWHTAANANFMNVNK